MHWKNRIRYIFWGFIGGFSLSLIGTTIEDLNHSISIAQALSKLHHYYAPFILGCLGGLVGFMLWRRKKLQIDSLNDYSKNLHALLDVNSTLISTLDLDSVLQIIIDESTHLTNLDTGAIYLHEDEKLFLGATTPPLPPDFPDILRSDLLINHPHIQQTLAQKQPLVLPDTSTAILSEAEQTVVEVRGLRSVIYIPLIIENRPVGTLILGSVGQLRSFTENEIDTYGTFSGQAALAIENARLYRKSTQVSDELRRQNEKFIVLNEELRESYGNIRKVNEELVISMKKAEESDRLKSAFLANMSHEIRTPLNSILGFSELLKAADLTGEQQQEYIRIIEKSGARMLNIINDIVDISKIESGTVQVSIKESDINESCDYIYDFFKPEAESKGLALIYSNPSFAEPTLIKTDHEKVCSILANLIKNAIKYTFHGSVEFGYDVVETDNHLSLQFFVKDTGIGIPRDRQKAVFERFIQADISDSKAYQGAGLGLTIAKAYVELLGGGIWVESEVGKGSTFYFTIHNQLPI